MVSNARESTVANGKRFIIGTHCRFGPGWRATAFVLLCPECFPAVFGAYLSRLIPPYSPRFAHSTRSQMCSHIYTITALEQPHRNGIMLVWWWWCVLAIVLYDSLNVYIFAAAFSLFAFTLLSPATPPHPARFGRGGSRRRRMIVSHFSSAKHDG